MNPLKVRVLAVLWIGLLVGWTGVARGQEYHIGPEDVLSVSFWQDLTLNQTVAVRQDGKITLSVVGEITAAGLTPSELAQKIGDMVSRYNRNVSQAAVDVVQYNSQKVFVTGQVRTPGKYAFETIPNAWELIREAGGITELGDLSNVVIVRGSKNKGEILNVDLAQIISAGDPSAYPQLYPGDVVEVKRVPSETGPGLPSSHLEARKNQVYVIGNVMKPGTVNLEEGMEVLDAISLAGGPSATADLQRVTVFNKQDQYSNVMKLDLKRRAEKGTPPAYRLRPEDTIYLPGEKPGGGTWALVKDVAALFGTAISTFLLIDRFK